MVRMAYLQETVDTSTTRPGMPSFDPRPLPISSSPPALQVFLILLIVAAQYGMRQFQSAALQVSLILQKNRVVGLQAGRFNLLRCRYS